MKKKLRITRGLVFMSLLAGLALLIGSTACQQAGKKQDQQEPAASKDSVAQVAHPQWSKDASIYEVNIRQFTPEGTFNAFTRHIPRLKELGVDILWIMPIHPIGKKNRKGKLGSYYSVKDYYGINPNFGDMEDFKSLVEKAHQHDMKVIIDWVANHTAWDNPLINKHPEWYLKDSTGNIRPPVEDWSDVAGLDYDKQEVRDYMVDAMKYWVKQAHIDGYRCDVAHMIPVDFWSRVHRELDQIKDVFMLAEAEGPKYHRAFDMTYAWELHHIMNQVAQDKQQVKALDEYLKKERKNYPDNAYRMNFTSNHDENSWNGTVYERMGEGAETFAAFTYTFFGMPLIYSGQEACLDKRLEFFKRDPINWEKDCDMDAFYKQMNQLKQDNSSLWNGKFGGQLTRIQSNQKKDIFAFIRKKGENQIFTILNFSDNQHAVQFKGDAYTGEYKNALNGEQKTFGPNTQVQLKPWGYKIYVLN